MAKELVNILRPLVGHYSHHIKNTQTSVEWFIAIRLEEGECITCYDVKSIFAYVPVDQGTPSPKKKKSKTQNYTTEHPCPHNTSLHCQRSALKTHFFFQDKYFEQAHRVAMGFHIIPIVANLFMEEFEIKAIDTATNYSRIWLRYVDETFVIQKAEHSHQSLQHINCIDPHIQYTAEDPHTDGLLTFWTL